MGPYLFPLLLVVAIGEMIVSGRWVRFYFTFGLPVFRRRVEGASLRADVEDRLEAAHSAGTFAPLVFKRLSDHEIAFREKEFTFRFFSYTPVMHGLIREESDERAVYVTGFANWFTVIFVAIWISAIRDFGVIMIVPLLLIVGFIYTVQSRRYASVARFLSSPDEMYGLPARTTTEGKTS